MPQEGAKLNFKRSMPNNGIDLPATVAQGNPTGRKSRMVGAKPPKAEAWRHLAAVAAGVVMEEKTRLG